MLIKKICAFGNCKNEFVGPPAKQYCDSIEYIKNKKKLRTILNRIGPTENNMQLPPNTFKNGSVVLLKCRACDAVFHIIYDSSTLVYPKYCEKHRNEHKRKTFLKQEKNGALAESQGTQGSANY